MASFTTTQEALGRLAAEVGPAVVGLGRGWGHGSGVVIAPDTVLTAAHAVRGDEVAVVLGGERRSGRVLGADPDLDVAVLRVPTGEVAPIHWEPAGDGDGPGIGTAVAALANPGGRGLRVTPGFVSSARRGFRGPRGRRIQGGIEHTAPLPRGSSGGPLVDLEGRLLGINAIRLEGGLILAVPADRLLKERVDALARGEAPERARLGVAVAPPRVARRLRRAVGLDEREGVLVRAVEEGSPAERAGLARGDLVIAAGGRPVDSIDVLYEALDAAGPDRPLVLDTVRGDQERAVEVAFS
jgi:S1-C subfamily serine protease